ncbi:MarR family transcriptional regulator [Ruminococcus sp. Marseille-P6503]|uniref:MarR family winged helix-turn-helix transcriptional regulator n=1 Tax=Ruminococcus sp. Marseille-P6503 TaxID=2364796 RepID=UPI000F51C2CF|nr:MarR family transcriptional regulator [Ruminococcus sp. Marseille-P6503]
MDYSKLVRQLFEVLSISYYGKPDLNFSEFFQGELKMLNYLSSNGSDNISPSDLCRNLYMTSARVAAALKSAERKGYVKRRISDSDRRVVIVSLTEEGRRYAQQKKDGLSKKLYRLLEQLGEKDSAELIRIIRRLTEISGSRDTEGEDIL